MGNPLNTLVCGTTRDTQFVMNMYLSSLWCTSNRSLLRVQSMSTSLRFCKVTLYTDSHFMSTVYDIDKSINSPFPRKTPSPPWTGQGYTTHSKPVVPQRKTRRPPPSDHPPPLAPVPSTTIYQSRVLRTSSLEHLFGPLLYRY